MYILYVTTKDRSEASLIAHKLLKAKKIACANILDGMTSIYEWEGEIKEEKEAILIAKTTENLVDSAIETIKSLHSYECPCILAIESKKGNKDFIKWLETCVNLDY